MSVNNTVNDADVVHGSIALTIDAQVYETKNLKIDQQVAKFMRLSSKGIGNGRVSIMQAQSGSATLMYPSSTVVPPVFGGSFSVTPNPGVGSPITYACTVCKVGEAFVQAGEGTVDIEFDVNFGTIVKTVAT